MVTKQQALMELNEKLEFAKHNATMEHLPMLCQLARGEVNGYTHAISVVEQMPDFVPIEGHPDPVGETGALSEPSGAAAEAPKVTTKPKVAKKTGA